MDSRREVDQKKSEMQSHGKTGRKRFRIEKLEERIAPTNCVPGITQAFIVVSGGDPGRVGLGFATSVLQPENCPSLP